MGGITVDNTGNLFVLTDAAPYLWSEFGPGGSLQAQLPTDGSYGVLDLEFGAPGDSGIEISSTGAWYELTSGGVRYSSPSAAGYATENLYLQGVPTAANSGIAIDRSDENIYVDQGAYIDQFTPPQNCGNPAAEEHGCRPSDTIGSGSLHSAEGLAFDPSNSLLYAADTSANTIAVFAPLPTPEATTGAVRSPGAESGTLTGHVDPRGPGSISTCYFEYGTDTTYGLGTVPCSPAAPYSAPAEVTAEIGGLTPFKTYHYRLVAIRADGKGFPSYGRDQTFTPAPGEVPSVDATSSSSVTSTGATLAAQINPNLAPTFYRFQYGTDTSYGSQTPPSESIGEDSLDHSVTSAISGLKPGTTYHFRVLAVNFSGSVAGQDQIFNTQAAPTIANSEASSVSQSAATLSAVINPGFSQTTYHFEYGPSAAYGVSTPQSASIGSDNSAHAASASVSGLSPGATYHFRLVATNAVGTTSGPDQTFTTAPQEAPVTSPPTPCRKGFVRRHGTCVRAKKHKRHHTGKRRQGRVNNG